MQNEIKSYLKDSADIKVKMVKSLLIPIEKAIRLIIDCYNNGGKILVCGNGGSAADAQHFAAEMVNRFKLNRTPIPAIALTTDTSIITAIGNDSGFDYIFEKQIKALGNKSDILIVITTSDISLNEHGHSTNIARALLAGREIGMKTIGLVSEKSKIILDYLDLSIIVPHINTPRIQEAHITILHIICELVEKELFSKE